MSDDPTPPRLLEHEENADQPRVVGVMTAADLERFWSRVHKTANCWEWTRGCGSFGYGNFRIGRKFFNAHRLSWEELRGPVPAGMQLDHLCRNPKCVNPEHLEVVTARINTLRGKSPAAANALKTHCQKGHALAGANLRIRRGHRECRQCIKDKRSALKQWRSGKRPSDRPLGSTASSNEVIRR